MDLHEGPSAFTVVPTQSFETLVCLFRDGFQFCWDLFAPRCSLDVLKRRAVPKTFLKRGKVSIGCSQGDRCPDTRLDKHTIDIAALMRGPIARVRSLATGHMSPDASDVLRLGTRPDGFAALGWRIALITSVTGWATRPATP